MERRLHPRKRAPKNQVHVFYKDRRIHRCPARDISMGGVFLASPVIPVPLGAKVQLVFVLSQGTLIKTHRKAAILTRIDDNGAGFGFLAGRRRSRETVSLKAEW